MRELEGRTWPEYTRLTLALLRASQYAFWFFHFVFAVTASTIVSGAMAERTRIEAYIVHSLLITAFIYPIAARWHGWLSVTNDDSFVGGMIDFAGSGVVHLSGGCIALSGAIFVGPRNGRCQSADCAPKLCIRPRRCIMLVNYAYQVPCARRADEMVHFKLTQALRVSTRVATRVNAV
eukprot:6193973-Pleurochrysis_carterae.AAC.3